MPWSLLWMLLWPSLAGIALALAAWALLRRGARPVQVGRALTAVRTGVAVLVTILFPYLGIAPLWIDLPSGTSKGLRNLGYALPLILALLLRRLRFETVEGKVPRPVAHLTVRAAEGIHLRVSRR